MITGAVIVHYMNWPEVVETIEDVLAQGIDPGKLVVVDNGSRTPIRADLESEFPGISIIDQQGNVGYGAAVNLGIGAAAAAGAVRVLVCTHEVRLPRNTLTQLERALDENDEVAVAAPVILRKSDPTSLWSAGGELSKLLWPSARSTWLPEPPVWVDGCCFLVEVDAFTAIGGMYEPYFMYMEEIDFFVRLRRFGRSIAVLPSAVAYQEPGDMTLYHATRNRILLSRRISPGWVTAVIIADHALRLVIESTILRRWRREKARLRKAGLCQGLAVAAMRPEKDSARQKDGANR